MKRTVRIQNSPDRPGGGVAYIHKELTDQGWDGECECFVAAGALVILKPGTERDQALKALDLIKQEVELEPGGA